MIRSISDFSAAWSYETEATMKVLRTLTDASLAQRVTPDGRSLGDLSWHLVQTLGEMPVQAGLETGAPDTEAREEAGADRHGA